MSSNVAHHTFLGMQAVFASEAMHKLLESVERYARTNAAVLITGESGTGKELIARAIHHYSFRCAKAWVDVSCGALPEHLVESELFGHEKGAFSGADSMKPGLFELAHGGTLFLDEVGELEPKLQVKLLRVLDGAPYYRLGGVRKVSVDVRIVAATNQKLEKLVDEGRYRRDLYHRLMQIRIEVPPLRERREDIEPLAWFLLSQCAPGITFSNDALELICGYAWPGNVRELRNWIIGAAALAQGGVLTAREFPAELARGARLPAPVQSLEGMERQMVLEALEETHGHHKKAAALLGISTRTLSRRLRSWREEAPV